MPDPAPRTVGDELVRAADRDVDQLRYIEQLYGRVVTLVAELERDLSDERVARERLELRVNAEWLRDRGYTIASARELDDDAGSDDALGSRNVVPLIREYAADTDELPTTDAPTPDGDPGA